MYEAICILSCPLTAQWAKQLHKEWEMWREGQKNWTKSETVGTVSSPAGPPFPGLLATGGDWVGPGGGDQAD